MSTRKRILLVDDEKINLDFFEVMLTKLGFTVGKAQDGVEAIERVKHFYPDLIILDNIMPKLSGWEVTRILKMDPKYRDIPIIMLSAMNDVKDKVEGFELGIDDYITKPFNFSEVLARIRTVLRNRELFGQIVVRESRLYIAEDFAASVKETLQDFVASIDDLDEAISGVSPGTDFADENALSRFVERMQEKTGDIRKQIAELDKRIEKALNEWQDLKKNEIGIQTLQDQILSLSNKDLEEGDANGK